MSGHRSPVVHLHVGLPKSGTSYMQALLEVNREALAAQGVLWPAGPWSVQVAAVSELRRLRRGRRLRARGPWSRLAQELRDWPGRAAVVSMEWMVNLRPHQIEAALASLAPCPVEVLCTARDLARTVPAAWQEAMQNGRTWAWDEYVEGVTAEEPLAFETGRAFWRAHDPVALARRWSDVLTPGRFHLVTVPPPGSEPTLLAARVCSVLGVDPTGFRQPPRRNESLGVASAQLMHLVNRRLAEQEVPRRRHRVLTKRQLSKSVLARRKGVEDQLVLPAGRVEAVARRSRELVTGLRDLDVHVVGDLDDLLPRASGAEDGVQPGEVPPGQLLDAAVDGLTGLAALTARNKPTRGPQRRAP